MNTSELLKAVMKEKRISAQVLADKLGYKTASCVTERLRRANGVRTDLFVDMLRAMDCEIVIKDKIGNKTQWVLDNIESTKE